MDCLDGKAVADCYYKKGYRAGVEAALTICLEAYYDTDSEKDPDILMRERIEQHKEGKDERKTDSRTGNETIT